MPTVNETLLALNIDELSPLEALTKLHELKRLAAGEMRAFKFEHDPLVVDVTSEDGLQLIRATLIPEGYSEDQCRKIWESYRR